MTTGPTLSQLQRIRPAVSSGAATPKAAAATTWGASYGPSTTFPVAPSYRDYGYERVAYKNTSSFTWTPSNVYISYHLYKSDGTVVSYRGLFTYLPKNVAPGQTITVDSSIEKVPAGSFKLVWDLLDTGSNEFFTQHGVPASGAIAFTVPHYPPTLEISLPYDGSTVGSLTPQFELAVYSDRTLPTSVQITVGDNDLNPEGIADSGWLTVNVGAGYYGPARWTIPAGKLKWGTAYYWHARVRDSKSTGPFSPITTFGTVIPDPDGSQHFGDDPNELDAAGVNVYEGNLARHATDLSLPTIGGPLEIARSYNSSDPGTGAFGYRWSSLLDMSTATSTVSGSTIVAVHGADGQVVRYGQNPDKTWSRGYGPGISATIKSPQELVMADGTDYHFAASAQANTYLLDSVSYPNGDVHRFTRSGSQVTSIVDSVSGRGLYLTWANGRVASVATDSAASADTIAWSYDYDGSTLVSACPPGSDDDPDRRCGHYTYGDTSDAVGTRGRMIREVAPADKYGWSFEYTDDGRVSQVLHGKQDYNLGANEGWYYDPETDDDGNRVVRVVDPVGTEIHYLFNNRGALTYQWIRDDLSTAQNTRSFGYDVFGQQSSVVDENGNSTEYYWDTHGLNTVSRFIDNRGTTSTTANLFDYPTNDPDDWRWHLVTGVRQGDPNHITSFTYNTHGQQLTKTTPPTAAAPDGETTTSTYTCTGSDAPPAAVHNPSETSGTQPCNMLASVTDPAGGVTRYAYDSAGNQTRITTPSGLTTDMYYDRFGRMTRSLVVTPPSSTPAETDYTYDGAGRVLTETDPKVTNPITGVAHQLLTTNVYDADGHKTSESQSDTTPASSGGDAPRKTEFGYDDAGRLSVTSHNGVVDSRVQYNGLGAETARYSHGDSIGYLYDDRAQLVGIDHGYAVQRMTYDDGGRLSSVTDAMGHTVNYTYTIDDLKASESLAYVDPTSGAKRTIALDSYQYDVQRNVVQDTAGTGADARTTTYTYDAVNRPLDTTVDPGGLNRKTTFGYDATGRKTSETLSDGTRTETEKYTYEATGRIKTQTVDNGTAGALTTRFTWDGAGHLLATSDPRSDGTTTAYTTLASYDALGRISSAKTPSVSTESGTPGAAATTRSLMQTFGYDTYGEAAQSKDADGRVTSTSYNDEGQRTGLTYPAYTRPDGTKQQASEAWTYDERGNVATHTDPIGTATSYEYDADDQPITVTAQPASGDPRVTRLAYDHNGNLLSQIDPTGAQTLNTYDGMDRLASATTVVRVAGQASVQDKTTYGYDDFGDPTSQTSPAVGATATYDHAGEVSTTTVVGRGTTSFGYDVAGRQVSTTDSSGRKSVAGFDAAGRQTSTTVSAPDGTVLRRVGYTLDAAGNRTSITDPLGNVQSARFDALNRVTSVTDAAPKTASGTQLPAPVTSFGYDAAGRPTRQTDARGNVTYQTYNALELPETRVAPATTAHAAAADRTWTTTYDAGGRAVKMTEPDGVVVAGSYDGFGDLLSEQGTGGGQDAIRTLGYDVGGRLTSETAPNGTQSFAYDDRGQLVQSDGPAGSATYKYDASGRLTAATDSAGSRAFTYNPGTSDVATALDSLTGLTHSYTYTNDGEVKTDSAATATGVVSKRSVDYDPLGRQATDTTTNAAGAVNVQTAYTWDADDEMLTRATSGAGVNDPHTDAYTYDADHRLVRDVRTAAGASTSTGSDFDFDAVGNRTKTTDWSGTTASHTTSRTTTYSYDQRNEVTGSSTSGSSTQYTVNGRGMLSTQTVTNGSSAPVTTKYTSDALGRLTAAGSVGYTYDSLDRLSTRTDKGAAAGAFGYSGLGLEPITDGTSTYSRDGGGNLMSTRTGTGTPTQSVTDAHGDAIAGLDPQNGAVSWNRTFSAFGSVSDSRGTSPAAGFQGSWTDQSTGLVHARSRWYDPAVGAFTQPDAAPPGFTDSVSTNDRLYGGADPVSHSDPSGHFSIGGLVGDLGDFLGGALDDIGSVLGDVGSGLEGTFEGIVSGLGDVAAKGREIIAAVEAAGETLADVGEVVLGGLEVAAEGFACAVACEALLIAGAIVVVVVAGVALYEVVNSDGTAGSQHLRINAGGGAGGGGGKNPPAAKPVQVQQPRQKPKPPPPPPHIVSSKYVSKTTTWKVRSRYWDDKYLYHRVDTYSYTTTYRFDYWSTGIEVYAGSERSATKHTVKITKQLLIDLSHPIATLTEKKSRPEVPTITGTADESTGGCGTGGSQETCLGGTQNPLPFGSNDTDGSPTTDGAGGSGNPPGRGGDRPAPSCDDNGPQAGRGPAASNYRGRYNADAASKGQPRLPSEWDAHHRIPQMYRGHPDFSGFDFDAPSNIRGVPGNRAGSGPANVHNQITQEWNQFAADNPCASGEEIEQFADRIDESYSGYWWR